MAKEILTVVFVCYLFLLSSSQTPPLQPSEMSALKKIAGILGKTDWNFSVNPCIGERSWRNLNPQKGFENDIACDCSTSFCHITSILLKSQGLSGTLPRDLSGLPFLMQLDLTRNYLTGEIPKEWGKLKLVHLSLKLNKLDFLSFLNPCMVVSNLRSLMSNRLSGSIPEELGNMITLKNITLDNNQFSGVLPPHIGNLTNLERLILSSNNFTGELPPTIARLTKMSDFRISDTRFSGRLPHFIENWTQLTVLSIQGTDLQGPIPSGFGRLTELRRLMMSDIKGPSSRIPYLSQMNKLEILILRNCNLFGEIPEDIGRLPRLQHLDLSFNKISGNIPKLVDERTLRYMFLTSNNLTGLIPDWVFTSKINIDLSLNNLLGTANGRMPNCEQKNVNLVESYSAAVGNQRNIPSCLKKNYPCSEKKRYSSLFIDCGSKMASTFERKTFQEDGETSGAATLIEGPNQMWAMSSTGTYLDNEDPTDKYIAVNSSVLSIANPELYMTARLSPLSLKYYGLCLYDGPYTVKLHFAEIVMTDDRNFSSLGQRIFDVYIQGNLVMKDFNIKEQAKGSGKSVILSIPANVTKGTLDIHLFWAGKGTTVVPYRGVYGPLLSAIEVTADFRTPVTIGIKKIVAVVISVLSLSLFFILLFIFYVRRVGKVQNRGGTFTLQQIKAATGNFDPSNQIGEGGFGPVYKGRLSDGTAVAVKRLASKSRQGNREFITETGIISALQHPNLVKLHGCCIEGDQLLLVYEYMENNSLSHALFARTPNRIKLDWPTRRKICLGIAKGLAYLHEESRLKIVHRDIKASNILLGKDLNAKISDFGLAKLEDDRNAHNNTRVVGTYGYIAPEYAMHGRLTCRADVYSFGIVALETVSGHSSGNKHCEECIYLLEWAYHLQEKGELSKLVDPEMGGNFCKEEAMIILNVALLCTDESPSRRPDMSMVVSMIEGKTCIQPRPMLSRSNEKNRRRSPSDERWNHEGSQNRSWTTSVSDPTRHDIESGHHNTGTSETPSSMEIVSIHSANKIYSPPNEPTERLLPWTA